VNVSPVLMPHAVCWAAAPHLVWTMVVANFVTFASYLSICGTLLYIARRTLRVMARDWLFFVVGFALFIVACGGTHLMDVITTWIPIFWVNAWVVIITAVLSAYIAIQLIRRANHVSFAINDYSARLARTQQEKDSMRDKLLDARKIEDWSRMSTVIAHEISNPLESIQNILYLLKTSPDATPESVRLAGQAAQEIASVITISRSTLSFHRESARPEAVDLCAVLESVRFLLRTLIIEKHIDFRIPGEHALLVEAFPGETRQVVLNLARNACEATRPGSTVSLTLTRVSSGVELAVADHGPGIDPNQLPRLFDFGHSTKGSSGNGLGLWTVKQIVEKHHGRITLDPAYREGARFVVFWPKTFSGTRDAVTQPELAPV
jgi:signal transduction histidine kinase